MRNLSILFVAIAFLGLAFTNPAAEVVVYNVDTSASYVKWVAKKVTGQHDGIVKVKTGNLQYTDGMLSGGTFVLDMANLEVKDLTGNMKGKLEGHLKSGDFFDVENHPEATFNITNVVSRGVEGAYKVVGELTIKGISKEIKFNVQLKEGDTIETAEAVEITLDRTEFNVRYGSGTFFENLGDKTIYDDFELHVNLVANK